MNCILLHEKDFNGKTSAYLKGYRHQHILKVLKSKPGDQLKVGLINDRLGTGTIESLTKTKASLKVRLTDAPPKPAPLTLILALPRPLVLNRLLLSITTLGIKEIYLLHCSRVEKSFWNSPVLKASNIKKQLILGLEQCRDTMLPNVYLKKRFKPFVEDECPLLIKNSKALVAHPAAVKYKDGKSRKRQVLVIGPEGGFIPYELEKLKEAGFTPASFGKRILKTETAAPFICSRLL